MADISKTTPHQLDQSVLRPRLEELAKDMSKRFGLTHKWEGDICHLSGGALKDGRVVMTDTTVSIELTLGFMAKMFKPKVEEQVEKWIDRIVHGKEA